jgi:hypothetical protein
MKPLNLDNSPCSPISSNCVIWQGPNIPCIKLCTGDTITDVIYALAMQLCDIVDAVNISTLDLDCLEITTGTPTNINQLLQILIDKICETNSIPAPSAFPTRGNSSCPTDCIVPVAACLQTGTQTTMKLLDYVQLIGNTICSILDDITTINNSITNITNRVIALESIPPTPPYVLPSVTPDCTLADGSVVAGVAYPLNIILTALINDNDHGYCALLGTTGQPSDITIAYNLGNSTVSGTDGALSDCALTLDQLFSTTWITTPTNLSESFIDLWLTVQDIRDAYKRYNVTAGNSNVTVTTTTTPGTCGPEISFDVKAKSSSVSAGTNITSVTTNVVGDNTDYIVNAKGTTVAAGNNITVATNTTDPANTIYTVSGKEAIVQAALTANNTVTVTPTAGPGLDDTTYSVYSQYGLEMFGCQWTISSATAGSWMTMPSQLASAGTQFSFPTSVKKIIQPNNITTTSSVDNLTYNISKSATNWFVSQAQFDTKGCSFGTFDVGTGFFYINEPGMYLISAFVHLKPDNTGDDIWTSAAGSFGIGLCADSGSLYAGQTQTFVPGVTRQVDLTCSKVIGNISTTPVYMSVLNYSDRNYDGSGYVGSDNIGFSIVKLRGDLTVIPGI